MLKVDGTTIYLTQGDTLDITLDLTYELLEDAPLDTPEEPYVPNEGDSIRFAIKSNYKDTNPIIVKDIPTDSMRLRLESSETKLLQARKKPYRYDIELTQSDGTVITFIDRAEFYSTDEVY